MTAAERLLALAGTTGTAAALLLSIGTGTTAGAALVDRSGLPSATAAQHLLADVSVLPLSLSGGGRRFVRDVPRKKRRVEENEALLMAGLI